MFSEFHNTPAQPLTQAPEALTPNNTLAPTLSADQPSGAFVKNLDADVNRWINSSPGGAQLLGDVANNRILGTKNANLLRGSSSNNAIYGGAGSDRLLGASGNDILCGEMGSDRLVGGSGSDILKGGPGKDTLTGNSGGDWFVLAPENSRSKSANADVVTDFTNGQDRILLEGGLTIERLSITQTKGKAKQTQLRDTVTGDVLATLKGVNKTLIDRADFVSSISIASPAVPAPSPAPSPAIAPTPSPAVPPKPAPSPAVTGSTGTIAFNATSFTIREGSGAATITVSRTGGTAGTAKVNYSILKGGTAASGADFATVSGTLTFASGQTTRTFAIPIVNDTQVEPGETVGLSLSSPIGARLGQSRATLVIADNDVNPPPKPTPTPVPAPAPTPVPVPAPAPSTSVVFTDTFENGISSVWNREVPRPEALQTVTSPDGNGKVARFELNRSDRTIFGGKRSEITLDKSTDKSEIWYGFKAMLPKNWQTDPTFDSISQWHDYPDVELGEDYRSPPLILLIRNGQWSIDNRWDPKPLTIGNDPRPEGGLSTLWSGRYQTGVWTKWVFRIKWSAQTDGLLQIWKDGSLVVNKRGANTYNDQYAPYFKVGLYKPAWRYSPQLSPVNSRVLYVDDVRVGNSSADFNAVVPR